MTSELKFGLKAGVVQAIRTTILKNKNVEGILIYGSRAKGNYKNGSDIDLTLIGPKLTLSDLLKIENDLEELSLPYKTDLSLHHQIDNPDLLDHIKRVGIEF